MDFAMDRRDFLKSGIPLLTLPALGGRFGMHAYGMSALPALSLAGGTGRILVLIELRGGNDGLNTVLPLDRYDRLAKARGNMLIPADKALKLDDKTALHPLMPGIHKLYEEGKVAIVNGVSYPNPNLSHFRASDIWFTASDYNQVLNTGFLGRYLSDSHPGFPEGYPNAEFPDPPAIQIGAITSAALHAPGVPVGMNVSSVNSFYEMVQGRTAAVPDSPYGHELRFLRLMTHQTRKYASSVQGAAGKATNKSGLYPPASDRNDLADQLKIVAQLIGGGLNTPVYMVHLGGFDTHEAQVSGSDVIAGGRHGRLLDKFNKAVTAFQDDLIKLGVEDKVMTLVTTEFGRRIKSNASYGTDHGTATPLFLIGKGMKGGILGANPEIPENVSDEDNLAMQCDFRSVYASLMKDWFQAPPERIRKTVLKDFPYVNLSVSTSAGHRRPIFGQLALSQNHPNPARALTSIAFRLPRAQVASLKVYTVQGREIKTLATGLLQGGEHLVSLPTAGWEPGAYLYRLQTEEGVLQRTFQVMR